MAIIRSSILSLKLVNILDRNVITTVCSNLFFLHTIVLEDEALNKLIKSYCRESGVRNLRKHIEKIFRKAAFLNVSEGQSGITISKSNLQDFVGKPVFSQGKHDFFTRSTASNRAAFRFQNFQV